MPLGQEKGGKEFVKGGVPSDKKETSSRSIHKRGDS